MNDSFTLITYLFRVFPCRVGLSTASPHFVSLRCGLSVTIPNAIHLTSNQVLKHKPSNLYRDFEEIESLVYAHSSSKHTHPRPPSREDFTLLIVPSRGQQGCFTLVKSFRLCVFICTLLFTCSSSKHTHPRPPSREDFTLLIVPSRGQQGCFTLVKSFRLCVFICTLLFTCSSSKHTHPRPPSREDFTLLIVPSRGL